MSKFGDAKEKIAEVKERLNTVTVKGESGGVVALVNGNRKLVNLSIDNELLKADKEELEDVILVALNRALEQAENLYETEMKSVTMGLLPGM